MFTFEFDHFDWVSQFHRSNGFFVLPTIFISLPYKFLATTMILQIYLAIGQLTSRLRKSSLQYLMHINIYFVTALPMCLTYPLTQVFHLEFFSNIFISVSSLSLQLQHLVTLDTKALSCHIHNSSYSLCSWLTQEYAIPHSFLPTVLHFHWSSSSTAVNPSPLQLPGSYHVYWLMAPSRITYLLYFISMNWSPFAQFCTMTFTYTLLFVVYSIKLEIVHKQSFPSLLRYFAICIQPLTSHHLLIWHSGQLAWWHFSPSFENLDNFLLQPLPSIPIAT